MFSGSGGEAGGAGAAGGASGALHTIYQRFMGSGADSREPAHEEFYSPRKESFSTPHSSTGDLLALSPPRAPAAAPAPAPCDDAFTDPDALDFLMRCTDSNNLMGDRGKESLFIKFDPLFAERRRSSTSGVYDHGYETESNMSVMDQTVITPKRTMSAGPINLPKDKPTQVVIPAINRTLPLTSETSRPPLVRSVSAIMSPARVAIDRLINYNDHTPTNILSSNQQYDRYPSQQIDRLHSLKAILQKQEQEAMNLREQNNELKYTVRDLEKKVQHSTQENATLLDKEKKLTQQLQERARSNRQMSIAMAEYEKTISSLIGEQQSEKTTFMETERLLRAEQEQAQAHLSSMESAFNDLLSKYEKCKTRMNEFKELEEMNRKKIMEYEERNKNLQSQYETLKEITTDKLSKANETLECTKKSHEYELMKLNATIKKYEVQVSSLQESLNQKSKENEQLTAICDQLIGKVH